MPDKVYAATEENETCHAIGYQSVSVCVPVTVTPFANTKKTITKCCGDPIVVPGESASCLGIKNGVCKFTISQTLCIAVPVDFGAEAVVGDTYTDCLGATAEDKCTNCNAVE